MSDILLKNRDGTDVTYSGVEYIQLKKADGEILIYTPGTPSEKTVELDFTDGDMIVKPDDGTVLIGVNITVPANLEPSNIVEGVTIAGIVGSKKIIELLENEEITLDFSNGNQTITAPDGYGIKTAVISKPDTLIPSNIAEGVEIAGVVGTFVGGGGSSDMSDELFSCLVYTIDVKTQTIIIYRILYDKLYEINGTYDVTIPDKIGDYDVVISSE